RVGSRTARAGLRPLLGRGRAQGVVEHDDAICPGRGFQDLLHLAFVGGAGLLVAEAPGSDRMVEEREALDVEPRASSEGARVPDRYGVGLRRSASPGDARRWPEGVVARLLRTRSEVVHEGIEWRDFEVDAVHRGRSSLRRHAIRVKTDRRATGGVGFDTARGRDENPAQAAQDMLFVLSREARRTLVS